MRYLPELPILKRIAFIFVLAGHCGSAVADWKEAANERIRKHRMSDLEVIVTDVFGNPVEDIEVDAKMRRHAYLFGTAINVPFFLYGSGDEEDRIDNWREPVNQDVQRYRREIEAWFNVAVFENTMKPAPFGWLNEARQVDVDRVLRWLEEREIPLRGHYLVGHAKFFGDGVLDDPAVQKEAVRHASAKAWRLKDRVFQWDAFNHPLATDAPIDFIERTLRRMRAADPETPLYLNEQWILQGGSESERRTKYIELARELQNRDVPLDGLGAMGHCLSDDLLTEPEDLLAAMDAIQSLGLPLIVTEHDFRLEDEKLMEPYAEKFLVTVYSHPVSEGILLWGFTDLVQWTGGGVLYDREWNLKPSGKVWERYVKGEWWTNARGKTDDNGRFVERLTHGEYELIVRDGDRTSRRTIELPRGGVRVHLVYPGDFRLDKLPIAQD